MRSYIVLCLEVHVVVGNECEIVDTRLADHVSLEAVHHLEVRLAVWMVRLIDENRKFDEVLDEGVGTATRGNVRRGRLECYWIDKRWPDGWEVAGSGDDGIDGSLRELGIFLVFCVAGKHTPFQGQGACFSQVGIVLEVVGLLGIQVDAVERNLVAALPGNDESIGKCLCLLHQKVFLFLLAIELVRREETTNVANGELKDRYNANGIALCCLCKVDLLDNVEHLAVLVTIAHSHDNH